MRNISRIVLVLAGALSAVAESTHEKILVPVFFSGPGAHGSQWTTTVSIANTGEVPVRFTRAVLAGDPDCSDPCGCEQTDQVISNNVKELCILNADPAGLLLYMEKNQAEVHFGARIADRSRSIDTAGTELKIVREHELRENRIVLPNIPIGAGYRVGLRLFDTFPPPTAEVVLRIYEGDELVTPLVEETIPLTLPADAGEPRPAHPAFAMIGDLAARYPLLANHDEILIELLLPQLNVSPPLPPSYWAVATITNNVTQQVTMVTPQ